RVRVVVIRRAKIDVDADILAGEGPVDDPLRDEVLVRDEVFAAVAGDHRHEAGAQIAYPPECLAERDRVPGFDRLVEQDDDAGDVGREGRPYTDVEADTHIARGDSESGRH